MGLQIINLPKVSVIILSYNRKEELFNSIKNLFNQDYKNIEVFVVDNNSTDGSHEMVKKKYPTVNLIQLKKNIGIGAYNLALEKATGDYVLFLDDDSYPQKSTISMGVKHLLEKQHDIIAFDILYGDQLRSENNNSLLNFSACGAMITNKLYQSIGGFQSELFLYMNEIEFTLRAYDKGFKTYFCQAKVVHNLNKKNRKNHKGYDKRKFYYDTRNIIIILIQKFYLRKVITRIIRIMLGRFFFALKNEMFGSFFKVIIFFTKNLFRIYGQRNYLSIKTQKHYNFGSFAGGFFFEKNSYKI